MLGFLIGLNYKFMKKTICLNMIVKNETHIIKRCFDSLRSHIDYWVISDTGSTDGTQNYIREYFKEAGIPGELIENQWEDFAHNRNLALQAAIGKADYILFMDADDYICWNHDLGFNQLTADAYMLPMAAYDTVYSNIKLVRSNLPWTWRGVLHEVLNCETDFTLETYDPCELTIQSTREGARSQDPYKYLKDAEVLEKALTQDQQNSRYQFYLGRSYFDAGLPDKALIAFERRVSMGDWDEEIYYSLLSMARCKEIMRFDTGQTIDTYLKSYLFRPKRLEGLYGAMKLCRQQGLYHLGYELGRLPPEIQVPDDVLFVDQSVYDWRFLDEFSVCAIQIGHAKDILAKLAHIIHAPNTPREQLKRLNQNLKIAVGF